MKYKSFVSSISFSPNSKSLAGGYGNGRIILWNVDLGEISCKFNWENYLINSLAFSPNGKMLATTNAHKTITIWNLGDKKIIKSHQSGEFRELFSVCFSHDWTEFASEGANFTTKANKILIWNAKSWNIRTELSGHDGKVLCITYHPRDKILASGGDDWHVILWNTRNG